MCSSDLTLQGRLPQELRLAGITDMEAANRFLKELFPPAHNARFATPPEGEGPAFVPFAGDLRDILRVREDRVVGNDNTVRYRDRVLQIPEGRSEEHTSELQSRRNLVCRLLLEKKK